MLSRLSSLPLLGLFVACHDSSGSSSFLPPATTSLGFAAESLSLESGILAAREFEDGRDLTGDGDGDDSVLHVIDLATGRSTLVPNVLNFSNGGGFVACVVREDGEGRDLIGDGDMSDAVLHVVDGKNGSVRNLGLAVDPNSIPRQTGTRVAFGVSEPDQGGIDLDGDGNAQGQVVHVHDASSGITTSLGIPVAYRFDFIQFHGSRLVALATEHQSGDLDGDGDALDDEVVFLHDLDTGTTENLGPGRVYAFDGHVLVMLLDELEQSRDMNGDGDAEDRMMMLDSLDTGARRILDSEVGFTDANDGLVWMLDDRGVLVYDALTDTLTVLGDLLLFGFPQLADRRAAFLMSEGPIGGGPGDLNGDGDMSDLVLFVFDARTRMTTNTRITNPAYLGLDERRAAYIYETDFGSFEFFARFRDIESGDQHELGPADSLVLVDGRIALEVPEALVGRDLNGDQDESDQVLQVYDPRSQNTFNTGLTLPSGLPSFPLSTLLFELEDHVLVIGIPEFVEGRDENGDGDTADTIVHAVRLP